MNTRRRSVAGSKQPDFSAPLLLNRRIPMQRFERGLDGMIKISSNEIRPGIGGNDAKGFTQSTAINCLASCLPMRTGITAISLCRFASVSSTFTRAVMSQWDPRAWRELPGSNSRLVPQPSAGAGQSRK